MTVSPHASVIPLPGAAPAIAESAFVAAGARVVGAVTLGELSSVWYNAVLRGDSARIVIGARSNVQDGVSIHVDAAHGVEVGDDVSIGHNEVRRELTTEERAGILQNAEIYLSHSERHGSAT